jgi:hypothetical protein
MPPPPPPAAASCEADAAAARRPGRRVGRGARGRAAAWRCAGAPRGRRWGASAAGGCRRAAQVRPLLPGRAAGRARAGQGRHGLHQGRLPCLLEGGRSVGSAPPCVVARVPRRPLWMAAPPFPPALADLRGAVCESGDSSQPRLPPSSAHPHPRTHARPLASPPPPPIQAARRRCAVSVGGGARSPPRGGAARFAGGGHAA